jgi:hypothetical protein
MFVFWLTGLGQIATEFSFSFLAMLSDFKIFNPPVIVPTTIKGFPSAYKSEVVRLM